MRDLKTPDFTPGAVVALLISLASDLYVILGLHLTAEMKGSISGAITTLTVLAFLAHDAHVRGKRAIAEAMKCAAVGRTPEDVYPAPD